MPSRTTDCRLLFGEEHVREIFAIGASLRRTAEGDRHGSFVSAVLRAGCTQVLDHGLRSDSAIWQTAQAHSPLWGARPASFVSWWCGCRSLALSTWRWNPRAFIG